MYSRIRLFFHHFPELQGFFIFKDIPVLPSASFSFFFYLPYSYLKKIGPPRKYQCFKKIVAPNAPPPQRPVLFFFGGGRLLDVKI